MSHTWARGFRRASPSAARTRGARGGGVGRHFSLTVSGASLRHETSAVITLTRQLHLDEQSHTDFKEVALFGQAAVDEVVDVKPGLLAVSLCGAWSEYRMSVTE